LIEECFLKNSNLLTIVINISNEVVNNYQKQKK